MNSFVMKNNEKYFFRWFFRIVFYNLIKISGVAQAAPIEPPINRYNMIFIVKNSTIDE